MTRSYIALDDWILKVCLWNLIEFHNTFSSRRLVKCHFLVNSRVKMGFSPVIETMSSSFTAIIYIFDLFYHFFIFEPTICEVWKSKNLCSRWSKALKKGFWLSLIRFTLTAYDHKKYFSLCYFWVWSKIFNTSNFKSASLRK